MRRVAGTEQCTPLCCRAHPLSHAEEKWAHHLQNQARNAGPPCSKTVSACTHMCCFSGPGTAGSLSSIVCWMRAALRCRLASTHWSTVVSPALHMQMFFEQIPGVQTVTNASCDGGCKGATQALSCPMTSVCFSALLAPTSADMCAESYDKAVTQVQLTVGPPCCPCA